MKKTFVFLSLVWSAFGVHAQNNTTLEANIKGLQAGQWVYCMKLTDRSHPDSVQTRAGGFTLKMNIPKGEADAYILQIGKQMSNENFALEFIGPGVVHIKGNGPLFKDAVFSGGREITDDHAYTAYIKQVPELAGQDSLYKKANDLYRKHDSVGYQALLPELHRLDSITTAVTKQWVLQHLSSPASAFILSFNLGSRLNLDEKESIYNQLSPEAKDNVPGKRLAHSFAVNKLTVIGNKAMDFTQNDTAGKPVSLKDFRGKYVLVDFWASWCVPCRGENPNVVKAFKKYHNRNFTVIGVSLDRPTGKEAWLKAIHDDGLTWTQVSDLQFWNNAVAKQYDINSIPNNLLIGPDGTIIGKELHGEELLKKLEEVLPPATDAAGHFSVEGTIAGYTSPLIYLSYYQDRVSHVDSAAVQDGHFRFAGIVNGVANAVLHIDRNPDWQNRTGMKDFLLDATAIRITGTLADLAHATIDGSSVNDDKAELDKQIEPIHDEEKDLSAAYDASNKKYMEAVKAHASDKTCDSLKEIAAALHEKFEPYSERMRAVMIKFIATHPDSYVSAMEMQYLVSSLPLDSSKSLFAGLSPAIRQSKNGAAIQKEIDKIAAGSPGSPAKDFTATELNGKSLTLSSFKGKYVLIDFWASWCVPCRHSNPHLKELYAQYHKKGLEVIGVSDDDGKPEAWKKAVTQDGVGIWHNVLRGLDWDKLRKGEPNEKDISEKFGIHSLPTKILIDRNGIIVGRYGEGRDDETLLDKKLEGI